MGKGYELDAGVLDGIHGQLRDARSKVEGLADSIPQGADAGDLAGALDGLLAGYVGNAAQLSTALGDVADGVEGSKKNYERAEEDAQGHLHRASGGL